ncbi:MAG: ABC transporter permease [Clostridiales bacterium]|nr:ABC transporter permease [Clostridiales bacterium]
MKLLSIWKFRISTFAKYRELMLQLVARDIKLKYRRSYIGYLWSVVNPLLTMLVLVAVFSQLFHRTIPNFPAYLICGQVLFNFMTESTKQAMNSIVKNASLLKKTYVPKYIFTLSTVTSSVVTLLLSFGAVIIVFIATGVHFTPYALLFFVPVLQVYLFSLGIGFFLAQAAVFFNDIQFIWGVVTTAWLYLSAIFYEVSILPGWLQHLVVGYNPMYLFITEFRYVMYQGAMFPLDLFWRGWLWAVGLLVFGLFFFSRSKNKFILYI